MRHVRGSAADLLNEAATQRLVQRLAASVGVKRALDSDRGEVGAWRDSLPALLETLCDAGLGDVEVLLEHRLPYSPKRVDALLCGRRPESGEPSYVLIELKRWSGARLVDEGLVRVPRLRNLQLPPTAQLQRYTQHLLDFIPSVARQGDPVRSVAYLHNAASEHVEDLPRERSHGLVRLFTGDQRQGLIEHLNSLLAPGPREDSRAAADELLAAEHAPARTLLNTAAASFEERDDFVLLDEQQVAYNLVANAVIRAEEAGSSAGHRKTVVIVRGGPGSGKSALATTLLTRLARRQKRVLHATGSKAFTETLRERVAGGDQRRARMFGYFNTVAGRKDELDVLICDEAHRIRGGVPDGRVLPEYERRQINALIDAARVPVFLLDEHQVVRPDERGTPENIRAAAEARGYDVHCVDLEGQFRCGGSSLFDQWVLRLLGLVDEPPIRWSELVAGTRDEYVVHAAPTAEELEQWLLRRSEMSGGSARISAGYCWEWNPPERIEGKVELAVDIDVNGWHRPWNTPSGEDVPGAPPTSLWASDPRGFDQVGCVYTAQGFEYDWAGVIFGEDLVVRNGTWRGQQDSTKDPSLKPTSERFFDRLVRNTYKVLLTRGMQGVCAHAKDPETNEFLQHHAR